MYYKGVVFFLIPEGHSQEKIMYFKNILKNVALSFLVPYIFAPPFKIH